MSIWALLGGLAGLAGSMYANEQNLQSARENIAFQRETLQNRNQWAVQDLKKAGLNPILAAGATQSTAAGAQAHVENPVSSAISTAAQIKSLQIAERQQKNQDNLAQAQIEVAKSTVDANSAKAFELREKGLTYAPSIAEIQERTKLYAPQGDMYGSSADFNRANVEYLNKMGAESVARIQKLESDLRTAEKQRDLLAAEVKTADSQTLRNLAESNLARKNAEIAEIRKEGEMRYNESLQIKNRLDSLGIGKAESDAKYYQKTGTKWFNENIFNPFKWSGR